MLLFLKKLTALMLVISMLSSCAVYPRFKERHVPEQCEVFIKKIELGFVGGGIRGGDCKADGCLVIFGVAAGILISSVIISSSIYLVGNTAHYIEKKARCDDKTLLEDDIAEFSYEMEAVGGKKIELEELQKLVAQKLIIEQKAMKTLELESEKIDVNLDKVEIELDELDIERDELQSELKGLN